MMALSQLRQPLGPMLFSGQDSDSCRHCTTSRSALMMALSQLRQPLGPMLFSGPLQPLSQFLWQSWHSPYVLLYLVVGHLSTQKGPSLTCLQRLHLPGPEPEHVRSHSSSHFMHWRSPGLWNSPLPGRQDSTHSWPTWKVLQDRQASLPGPQQPSGEHCSSQTNPSRKHCSGGLLFCSSVLCCCDFMIFCQLIFSA